MNVLAKIVCLSGDAVLRVQLVNGDTMQLDDAMVYVQMSKNDVLTLKAPIVHADAALDAAAVAADVIRSWARKGPT